MFHFQLRCSPAETLPGYESNGKTRHELFCNDINECAHPERYTLCHDSKCGCIYYNILYNIILNADNLMNPIKSDETAVCDNNDGSFSCICDDGYEHKSDPAEGFYLNFLIPKNSKFFITKN